MRKRILLFAVLVAALAVLCTLFAGTASDAPYTYDEADYMYAGTHGLLSNYLDRNAMPLGTYVRKGVELARHQVSARSMSDYVRSSGDVLFYRHYHGPVYACWIALWHDFGVQRNAAYRAAGLIVHVLGSIAIFWLFLRAFPDLPEVAALVAALMFAMNRTALLTATMITQHLPYTFFACLALFAVALYLRSRQVRYWYAGAALLAASFAAVEIASVLVGAVALSVIVLDWREGWKKILALMGKGALVFAGALAIIWPPGVYELDGLKGYVYLAYLALVRKVFTPITPRQLWVQSIKNHPLEFVLPLAMAVVAVVCWRRLADRRAVTPFLVYSWLFFGATMVITSPNDYYHCSLMMSLAVVTGVLFGEMWKRVGVTVRAASLAAVLASLVALDATCYGETVARRSQPAAVEAVALQYLAAHPPGARTLMLPATLLPTLHYYYPDNRLASYDIGGNLDQLASASTSAGAEVFCPESSCRRIEALWPPSLALSKEQLQASGQDHETWYAMTLDGSR
jgi:Dolichyl-phosphate-mannose-protein mannosyltransferase